MSATKRNKISRITRGTIRRARQIKRGKISLQVKILFILGIFAAILTIANVFNVNKRCNDIFDNYFTTQLTERSHGIMMSLQAEADRACVALKTMSTSDTTFVRMVENADYPALAQKLDRLCHYSGTKAYLLLGADNDVTETNLGGNKFDFEESHELRSVASSMQHTDGHFAGLSKMVSGELSIIGGQTLRNSQGDLVGTVFMIVHTLTNDEYLDMLKSRHQTDITIFEGDVRVSTTMFDKNGDRMVGTKLTNKAALDKVYKQGLTYDGKANIGGRLMFVRYAPTNDVAMRTTGMLYTGIDAEIASHLKWMIIISMFVGGIVICALLTILTFVYVRRTITRPLRSLASSARQIAAKDLTQPVLTCTSGDELQELSESMQEMQSSLTDTIAEVYGTANMLHQSSNELSRASLQLSDGANKQAASLEEIAASLEDVRHNINSNTENSMQAKKMAELTNTEVTDIAQKSEECMTANKDIAGAIRNINTLVGQTNILSLNASVEAARAGSHGKGFAVVAKEVGRLAEQTKNTAGRISTTTQSSIEGTEQINKQLAIVTPQLNEMVGLMKEIASSSMEQKGSTQQIANSMSELNKTTQSAAASAEEIAANAEELSSSAQHLHEIIGEFKLEDNSKSVKK